MARKALLLLCATLMAPSIGWAAEGVTLSLDDLGHGTYHLTGHMTVEAPLDVAWKVLTDYDHIATFVSSLRKSRVKETGKDGVLLEQEALGKKLFFSKKIHVLLRVTEVPQKRIDFEDVLKKDFVFYNGSWEIQEGTASLDILYRLDCQRRFMVPNFMAKGALRNSAEGLLGDVRNEIVRRRK